MSWKRLFSRSLAAAPGRLHMAAHSHHLWPDASFEGQLAAWEDAARLADDKWDKVMGEVWPAAQRNVAAELKLPDPAAIVFAPNTHDLLLRIVSAIDQKKRPLRVLSTDGEFHSFRRQSARWIESGMFDLERVAIDQSGFPDRFLERASSGAFDLIFVSHVMFGSGQVFDRLSDLATLARADGPWVVVDGYHAFMAIDIDLSPIADRIFYLAGGYKYAMTGEGAAFMHAPSGFGARPEITGWFASFDELAARQGEIGYAPDARRYLGATFDPSALYRFNAVQAMLKHEGLTTSAISAHVDALLQRLIEQLAGTPLGKARLINGDVRQPRARFLAFQSPNASRWQADLARAGVVTDSRGDVLRIGLALYHDPGDIDRFCKAAATL
jgi:selenocysteine lyase/cysteine desulfurase